MALTITILALIAFLSLLSAAVSAIEASLTTLRPHHLETLEETDESARLRAVVNRIRQQREPHLLAVLMAGALLNLGLVVACLYFLNESFLELGVRRWVAGAGLLTAVILITDVLPKSIALNRPRQTLRRLATPMRWMQVLLTPVAARLQRATDQVVRALTPGDLHRRSFLLEDELETWVEMRREIGTLHAVESEIIQEILRLGDKTAKDCMTPRVDVRTIPDNLEEAEARARILACPHWRIPAYHEELDGISGVLDVKAYLLSSGHEPYTTFINPPVFVPETMSAIDLFTERLQAPHGMVIVLDEYGGFEGIVTYSDVIEELMADAAPPPDHEPEIQNLGGGRLLVTGAARLDEIGPELDLDLEEEGLDTIGGLVFNRLTYLPEPGTRVDLGSVTATIRRCSRHRIEELLLESNVGPSAFEPPGAIQEPGIPVATAETEEATSGSDSEGGAPAREAGVAPPGAESGPVRRAGRTEEENRR